MRAKSKLQKTTNSWRILHLKCIEHVVSILKVVVYLMTSEIDIPNTFSYFCDDECMFVLKMSKIYKGKVFFKEQTD